jgi:hypothetical protein
VLQPHLGQKWGGRTTPFWPRGCPKPPLISSPPFFSFFLSFDFHLSFFFKKKKKNNNGQNDVVLGWVSVVVLESVRGKIGIFYMEGCKMREN